MIGVIKGDTRSLDYSSNVGPLVRALHKVWGFPSIGGTYKKDYNVLGSTLGPLNLGNYHLMCSVVGFRVEIHTRQCRSPCLREK